MNKRGMVILLLLLFGSIALLVYGALAKDYALIFGGVVVALLGALFFKIGRRDHDHDDCVVSESDEEEEEQRHES